LQTGFDVTVINAMNQYTITVTPTGMVTASSIPALWANIVAECQANMVISNTEWQAYYANYLVELQALSNSTGVDIIALSQTDLIIELGGIMNSHLSKISNSIEYGELTQAMLEDLKQRAQVATTTGNECEQLQLLSEIGMMMYPASTLNMEHHCGSDISLPTTNLNNLSNSMAGLFSQIRSLYPSFNGLSTEMQANVLAEAWHHYELKHKLDTNGGKPPICGPLEDERDRAIRLATISFAIATAAWVASAAAGGFLAAISTPIYILACATYDAALNDAWRIYWLQGGKQQRSLGIFNR
jgi:hypothetical protein